jgi:hypothetical protein
LIPKRRAGARSRCDDPLLLSRYNLRFRQGQGKINLVRGSLGFVKTEIFVAIARDDADAAIFGQSQAKTIPARRPKL